MSEQLIQEWKELAGCLSYYNAGEGPSYSSETEARNKCRDNLRAKSRELLKAGIEIEPLVGNYLISGSDYVTKLLSSEEIKTMCELNHAGKPHHIEMCLELHDYHTIKATEDETLQK